MKNQILSDEELDQVIGGLMNFNYDTKVLTYTHEERKTVTKYNIVDFEKAWKLSNARHAENVHEDNIIAEMLSKGYIAK